MWSDWRKVFWQLAQNGKSDYDSVKSTEEVEFYDLLEIEKDRLEKMKNNSNYMHSNGRRR